MDMTDASFDFGMIGLGVMGRNFLLNMADHGFSVVGLDKDDAKAMSLETEASPGTRVKGVTNASELVRALKRPRRLMMLVPAGKPVDDVIAEFLPMLEAGDIILDGGNSHYTDTLKRINALRKRKIHFVGMGVSGGEKGARTGPSIMPGGDPEAWEALRPMLEAVAAQVEGSPCVAYMGKGAAGHYVKMVHNGIEYAIMQVISETYQLLHEGLGLSNEALHDLYADWNEGDLQSFLLEITRDIFGQEVEKGPGMLIDKILDEAGAKGTGKWTSQDAMDLHYPVPAIDTAVAIRDLSAMKAERVAAEQVYGTPTNRIQADAEGYARQLKDALGFAMIVCYAQGMGMLHRASADLGMNIPLGEVVRIWRGGCIIRSRFLDTLWTVYGEDSALSNPLLAPTVAGRVKAGEANAREALATALRHGFPVPGLSSCLSYFDAFRRKHLPVNLIQAQRDYFGSHTYQRIDEKGTFHTQWEENP